MVVVEFEYEEMKKLIDLPKDRMIATLSDLGAPSEYEPEIKKIITELTPNRPDWYSMEGLARSLRAYTTGETREYTAVKSKYVVEVEPVVSKVRPYTACAVVKGLAFNDQRIRDIILLQEKLVGTLGRKVKKFGLGVYPLQAIKFPIKYTTMKPADIKYIPLGYDREMTATEILEKHKKGQQYGNLLSGETRYPVFISADGKIMSLIPIVNSAETGKVDETTTEIFIEVSGTELHACKAALNILACTFADMGGTVYEVAIRYKKETIRTPDLKPKTIKLDLDKVNGLLGMKLKETEIAKLLKKMGYNYRKGIATVPPYRADILGLVDITEDIAIAYGYNNFTPTIPDFFHPGKTIRKTDELDNTLRGMGFVEIQTFILTNKERLKEIGADQGVVEISNPSTVDYTVVRPTLILSMLEVFINNKMKGLPQKYYEIGVVRDKGTEKRVCFASMDKKVEFSDFRGYLQTISQEIGKEMELRKENIEGLEDESSCSVICKNQKIGVFGKMKESVLRKFGIEFEIYICEMKLD